MDAKQKKSGGLIKIKREGRPETKTGLFLIIFYTF
jgi:hypothetical protein